MRGQAPKGKLPLDKGDAIASGSTVEVDVEGDEEHGKAVIWNDKRMWPYECDNCEDFIDEPVDGDGPPMFECYGVSVDSREIHVACCKGCAEHLRDSEQVLKAITEDMAS